MTVVPRGLGREAGHVERLGGGVDVNRLLFLRPERRGEDERAIADLVRDEIFIGAIALGLSGRVGRRIDNTDLVRQRIGQDFSQVGHGDVHERGLHGHIGGVFDRHRDALGELAEVFELELFSRGVGGASLGREPENDDEDHY